MKTSWSSLQKAGVNGKLVEEKGKKAKAFGILTKLERKRRNTYSAANLDALP
ncbi:MAG TPA: hypothetical protein VEZ13_10225 [Brevibacillus sp.]|nr:hypothetical protein [Brevibacillus sp.]